MSSDALSTDAPTQVADYSNLDSVQLLAAAASDSDGFEAALDAVLNPSEAQAPPAISNTPHTPDTQSEAGEQAAQADKPFTPDYENQLRALQEAAAEREQHNAQLQQQLATLQAQLTAQNNPPAPEEKPQSADVPQLRIDPALFGDLSETNLAKGIEQAITQVIPYLREQVRAEAVEKAAEQAKLLVEQQVKPVVEQHHAQAANAHEAAILAKHPDAHEAVASKEFRQWVQGLPTFARQGVLNVIEGGTTEQVVEMFDAFKSALPDAPDKSPAPAEKLAPVAVDAPKSGAPLSLSQVQGTAPASDPLAALGAASGEAQLVHLNNMPLQQVEEIMAAAQRAMLH